MGGTGLEHINVKPSESNTYENSKKSTVQNPVHLLEKYPELADLLTRWPSLSEHIRQAIKALVESHKTEERTEK